MKLAPFRSALNLHHEFDRLFNGWPSREIEWQPAVDVKDTEEAFVVTAELPGVKSEDLKINLDNNVLSIFGSKSEAEEEKEAQNKFWEKGGPAIRGRADTASHSEQGQEVGRRSRTEEERERERR